MYHLSVTIWSIFRLLIYFLSSLYPCFIYFFSRMLSLMFGNGHPLHTNVNVMDNDTHRGDNNNFFSKMKFIALNSNETEIYQSSDYNGKWIFIVKNPEANVKFGYEHHRILCIHWKGFSSSQNTFQYIYIYISLSRASIMFNS